MQLLREGEELGEWATNEVGLRFQLPPMAKWQTISTMKALGTSPVFAKHHPTCDNNIP